MSVSVCDFVRFGSHFPIQLLLYSDTLNECKCVRFCTFLFPSSDDKKTLLLYVLVPSSDQNTTLLGHGK